MIKIKTKTKKKAKPYYKLTFDYMIGDANGNTSESMKIMESDTEGLKLVEKFVPLMNKLNATKGTWGIVLDGFGEFLSEGQITEEEWEFLSKVSDEYYWTEEYLPELYSEKGHSEEEIEELLDDCMSKDESIGYFSDVVKGDTEYSFLVFQGAELTYYDETGSKHKTSIEAEAGTETEAESVN